VEEEEKEEEKEEEEKGTEIEGGVILTLRTSLLPKK
jgi:hypothetical protein